MERNLHRRTSQRITKPRLAAPFRTYLGNFSLRTQNQYKTYAVRSVLQLSYRRTGVSLPSVCRYFTSDRSPESSHHTISKSRISPSVKENPRQSSISRTSILPLHSNLEQFHYYIPVLETNPHLCSCIGSMLTWTSQHGICGTCH